MRIRQRRQGVWVLDRRSITVVADGGAPAAPATFAFPDGLDWSTPAELAEAFRAFCAERGVKARRVEAGVLPGEWTVVRELTFPPVEDASLLPAMVAIAAEKAFAERAEELSWAYEAAATDEGCEVSLFACLRSRLSQLQAFFAAAGVQVRRLTPLAVAAAAGLDLPAGPGVVVCQRGAAAEVVSVVDGRVRSLRRVGLDDEAAWAAAALSGEGVLRVLGEEKVIRAAERAFDAAATREEGPFEGPDASALAAARGVGKGRPAVDFLACPGGEAGRRWTPLLRRVVLVAAVALCLSGWFALDWRGVRVRAARAEERLAAVADRAEQARLHQSLLAATNAWADDEPRRLGVLKALATEFPADGVIWLTGLHMDEDGAMTLSGKASDRGEVLALFDRLRASEAFEAVEPHYVRQQAGGGRDVSFVVACRCVKGAGR